MSKRTIKETVISAIEYGNQYMEDIKVLRKHGKDFNIDKDKVKNTISALHQDSLDLRVSEVFCPTKETKTIRFVSENGTLPVFQAGQYVNVFVEIDGVRTSRPYSISSSPKQRGYYEITVAKIPTGFVSDYFVDSVKAGDTFQANGPAGTFIYNPVFQSKKSVFLAGGSGITPFLSMSREALESGADREITLIYGVRKQELAIANEELEDMARTFANFKYELVLSDEEENTTYRKGFMDAKCIEEVCGDLSDKTFYICGPPIMADFCVKTLQTLGVKEKDIRREMFGSRQDINNEPGWPKELTGEEVFNLKVGDIVVPAKSSESILTALERHGVRVNVCCRSGECSLCRVKHVSGRVFMPRGVLSRLADEKFNFLHSCKAYPIEDVEIEF